MRKIAIAKARMGLATGSEGIVRHRARDAAKRTKAITPSVEPETTGFGESTSDDCVAFPLESHPLNALFAPIPVGIEP
jgi:hypothetical protein